MLQDILKTLNLDSVVSNGTNNSIYKDGIICKTNEKQAKKERKKIRSILEALMGNVVNLKTESTIKNFIAFYLEIYAKNDFSLESICTERANDEKKALYKKGLQICKEYHEKQSANNGKNKK